jgi:hypothetical protein
VSLRQEIYKARGSYFRRNSHSFSHMHGPTRLNILKHSVGEQGVYHSAQRFSTLSYTLYTSVFYNCRYSILSSNECAKVQTRHYSQLPPSRLVVSACGNDTVDFPRLQGQGSPLTTGLTGPLAVHKHCNAAQLLIVELSLRTLFNSLDAVETELSNWFP